MQVQCSEKCSLSWWTRTQKRLEVETVPSATSANTIAKLWAMFATDGLLQFIVSNIRTAFTSSEFQEFLKMNGFHHVKSAPNHPASNELTELYVQTFKSFMTSSGGDDLQQQLSQFLFQCHSTPHSATGVSPAQLLMGRRLLMRLDQMHPSVSSWVTRAQTCQKTGHDHSSCDRQFKFGDSMLVRNFTAG